MSTLASLALEIWGGVLTPREGRFVADGWNYEESFASGCSQCDGELHAFGKPYETTQGSYRYAAYVCPSCNVILTMADLGVKTRNELQRRQNRTSASGHGAHVSAPEESLQSTWSTCQVTVSMNDVGSTARLRTVLATLDPSPIPAKELSGTAGVLLTVTAAHQRTSSGCQSTEATLAAPVGGPTELRLTVRECCEPHGVGEERAFAPLLLESFDVDFDGASPWIVGHTSKSTVASLVAQVQSPVRRVPIVAVSGPLAEDRAISLRNKLSGAALVTTVDGDAAWEITARLGASQSCYAGAARIYPSASHRVEPSARPVWVSRRIAELGWDATEREIADMVSVLNPAPPRHWLEAELLREEASKAAEVAETKYRNLELQIQENAKAGGSDEEIEELFTELAEDNRVISELLSGADVENRELAGRLDAVVAENDRLRAEIRRLQRETSDDYLEATVSMIDVDVEGAIMRLADPLGPLVCTENALKAWRSAKYPDEERMLDAIRQLERAAQMWRALDCQVGGRLEDWIYEQVQLRYAASDKGLRKAGLDEFSFEGTTWSRVPHIKIDDAKHANQVGRIYFAIDRDQKRWVVDHVGQKLYGR